jgi:hypothetical protein
MPSPSPRFARAVRKLEDLPSDGGQAVDTLAGANLRIFIRLGELEAALAKITSRLAALESLGADAAEPPLESPEADDDAPRVSGAGSPEPHAIAAPDEPAAGSAVSYTLSQAARATGRNKGTIASAIAAIADVLEFEAEDRCIDEVALFTDGIEHLVLDLKQKTAHGPFFRCLPPGRIARASGCRRNGRRRASAGRMWRFRLPGATARPPTRQPSKRGLLSRKARPSWRANPFPRGDRAREGRQT